MALMVRKNRLREVRKSLKISAYDLQLLSHIPAQTIYAIERGLKRPAAHEKTFLSQALKLSEFEIFPAELAQNGKVEVIS
jgi:transcriptional regulator with XRE-family HTH domain